MQRFRNSKVDVGIPRRALLRPGDAFIAHQRLAHSAGFNLSDIIRKNVYFRVMRHGHAEHISRFIQSETPWVGFNGLNGFVPDGQTHQTGNSLVGTRTDFDDEVEALVTGEEDHSDRDGAASRLENLQNMLSARSIGHSFKPAIRSQLLVSTSQKESFLRDGYLILRKIVRKNLLSKAIERCRRHIITESIQ